MSDTPFGELRNPHGEQLDYACAGDAGPDRDGLLVVICHGVTANKDRAWALTLAAALTEAGHANLRFSFSGNGASEGDFEASTVTKEVEDLGAVLDVVSRDGQPLCVVGHSMGGAVGVLRAASDPRIDYLISLAGMVHTHDFAQRKFGELTPGSDLMWEKPECPLSSTFMEDMQAVDTVLPLAAKVQAPWLLVHGSADTVVPIEESREVAGKAGRSTLVELAGADHLFSGEHEAVMAKAVVDWLGKYVRR